MSRLPSNLTRLPGVPDSSEAVPGMAFFAGSGPIGSSCGTCEHRGYWRQSEVPHWNPQTREDEYKTYRHYGCAKFKALSGGRHGPMVRADNRGCKYFEAKP